MLRKACLPAAAINNKSLNDTDRRVLLALSLLEKSGQVIASRDQIHEITGLIKRNITRSTTKLQAENWLLKAGNTHQIIYYINWNWPESAAKLGANSGTNTNELGIDSGTNTNELGANSGTNTSELGIDSGTNTNELGIDSGTNTNELGIDSGTNTNELGIDSGTNISKLEANSGTNTPRNNKLADPRHGAGNYIYINNININKEIYINTVTRENIFNFVSHYQLKISKKQMPSFNVAVDLWIKESITHQIFHGACERAKKHATNGFINANYMGMLIKTEAEELKAKQNDTSTKDFTQPGNYQDAANW